MEAFDALSLVLIRIKEEEKKRKKEENQLWVEHMEVLKILIFKYEAIYQGMRVKRKKTKKESSNCFVLFFRFTSMHL